MPLLDTFFLFLAFLNTCTLKVNILNYFTVFFFQLCNGFDINTNACTDRKDEKNQCSCVEVIKDRVYRISFNGTAGDILGGRSVWLEWSGPPDILSIKHTLPEIKGWFEIINSHADFYDFSL